MQQYMRQYQNDFSIKFAQTMQRNIHLWKVIQKQEQKSLYSLKSIGEYLFVALLGFIPGKHEREYSIEVHCVIAVIFFIVAIIVNIQVTNKVYQNEIKSSLFPELLKVFGEKIFYNNSYGIIANSLSQSLLNTKDAANILSELEVAGIGASTLPNNLFESSCLYPKQIMYRNDDDSFYGEFNDVKFDMVETDFGWIANDKHHTHHSMFKGLAMKFKMNKFIKSRVLILTKHSFTKIPKNFERVNLELDKFNKKYDIWVENNVMGGSGQIESRYLLNTVFMERLLQIQTSFRVSKMCCSVYGEEMLVMLSTNRDLFEMNHLLGHIDDIKQYKHLFDEFSSVLAFMEVLNLKSKTGL